jgi:hypothetical protein
MPGYSSNGGAVGQARAMVLFPFFPVRRTALALTEEQVATIAHLARLEVRPDDAEGTKADLVDGSIGEGSMFHETFGYYAQGVVEKTAVLPRGWRDRLVRFERPSTSGVVAWCLEPHDLWISKAIAGRPKDLEFCRALVEAGLVKPALLRDRLAEVEDLSEAVRKAVEARIPG